MTFPFLACTKQFGGANSMSAGGLAHCARAPSLALQFCFSCISKHQDIQSYSPKSGEGFGRAPTVQVSVTL